MKNINYEKIKYLFFKHSKLIIALLTMLLIILISLLFKTSYSSRNFNEFDEIQNNLDAIYIKDKNLYNKTKVELIKKEAKGIDISSWQGKINWDKISQLDIDFVIIRCGLRG